MKITYFFILLLLFNINLFGQDTTYTFDLFKAELHGKILKVLDNNNKPIFQKSFNNPSDDAADLDGDGIDEYLVTDSRTEKGFTYYSFYIFNTIDSFYVADSINSGLLAPYPAYSKELNSMIIAAGDPRFDSFNNDASYACVPMQFWKYDNGQLMSVDDEIYDLLISENETLIDNIDSYLENNPKDCHTSGVLNALVVSVYVNYLNAGEKILAKQFLTKYYFCNDIEAFKQKINSML